MRAPVAFVLLFAPPPLLGQQAAPRFIYIYRDSLKAGVDSAYRVIEDEGAQICADFHCPNPYLGLESLSGPHEAWAEGGARIFAVRPNWSMPAPDWVAADRDFWRLAPAPKPPRERGKSP